VSVTGALGRRTVHQLDPKAQLVAALSATPHPDQQPHGPDHPPAAAAAAEFDLDVNLLQLDDADVNKEMEGMQDDSDVFAAPVMEVAAAAAAATAAPRAASGAEQALLLAWAAQVKKGSSADELQQWQMAPYVEAALTQPRSQFMLQVTARLLKARHERTRGRTRERALLALEQLCAALAGGGGGRGGGGRRPYAYTVSFPVWPLLRKELAEHHIAMGFVGE